MTHTTTAGLTATADMLRGLRDWDGDDHAFVSCCMLGEYGTDAQHAAERAIAAGDTDTEVADAVIADAAVERRVAA